jgi:hypothetical protein
MSDPTMEYLLHVAQTKHVLFSFQLVLSEYAVLVATSNLVL